ncbi:MAG: hypothetical protein R3E32_12455 [Chitinophagales bacterium]
MKTTTLAIFLFFLSSFSFAQEIHYFNKPIINTNSFNYSLSGFEVDDGFIVLNYNHIPNGGGIYLNLLKLDEVGIFNGRRNWEMLLFCRL